VNVELPAGGTAAALPVDVDGPLVPDDSLQPDAARAGAQATVARIRTTELRRRSARGRTVRFMIIDSTAVTDLEEQVESCHGSTVCLVSSSIDRQQAKERDRDGYLYFHHTIQVSQLKATVDAHIHYSLEEMGGGTQVTRWLVLDITCRAS
jgi:hypothetical protein